MSLQWPHNLLTTFPLHLENIKTSTFFVTLRVKCKLDNVLWLVRSSLSQTFIFKGNVACVDVCVADKCQWCVLCILTFFTFIIKYTKCKMCFPTCIIWIPADIKLQVEGISVTWIVMASIGYKTHVSEFLEEKQSSFCRVGNGASHYSVAST